ncbi:MAG: CheR family methyltransferase [Ardenticatenaceae bacterium]
MDKQPAGTDGFETLLEYLKRNRGFDFTGYKRTSLGRRIRKRMHEVGVADYEDYIDYLEVRPDEFMQLFNTILINVTDFFRDPEAWSAIADEVIPRILANKRASDPIRVWSVGCADGKEAYTIAILLAEALGEEAFRDRVKIYATDVDEEALTQGRHASYTAREVESLPEELRDRYFELNGSRYIFRKELRRSVIFGRHDLVQDAPISRIDLLICRNTLMYFNSETQRRILARFHFALNEAGLLFMGRAEMLLGHANFFAPVNLRRRIFSKVRRPNLRERLLILAQTGGEDPMNHDSDQARIREATFDANPIAQVVVDADGSLILANERARALFGLKMQELGNPLQDFELSYRPLELRSHLELVYRERRSTTVRDVMWEATHGETRWFDVQIAPLLDQSDDILGATIVFEDVTPYHRLQEQLTHSNQELETAYEELQSTNEELETTNEELQSTIEELETTNEELQSTNEELETMNAELQSTNEELETMNNELRHRSSEYNQINAFLESILTSLDGAVVVLDRGQRIQVWNPRAEELWGLRRDEVEGKHFQTLDIGLPVEQLKRTIRACLSGVTSREVLTLEALNRRGRSIQCNVTCTPLRGAEGEILGVIVVMEAEEG